MDKAGISKEVAAILAEVEADIAARRPVCRASGRCCKFEEYGHRLYVTAAELLHFALTEAAPPPREIQAKATRAIPLPQFFAGAAEGCPYQVEKLCIARAGRPLGCRVYFCDENTTAWQPEVYEKYHAKLRDLHERFGLPYRYMEWRVGLRELSKGEGVCE